MVSTPRSLTRYDSRKLLSCLASCKDRVKGRRGGTSLDPVAVQRQRAGGLKARHSVTGHNTRDPRTLRQYNASLSMLTATLAGGRVCVACRQRLPFRLYGKKVFVSKGMFLCVNPSVFFFFFFFANVIQGEPRHLCTCAVTTLQYPRLAEQNQ